MTTALHRPPRTTWPARTPLRLVFFGFLSWIPVFAVATAAQGWRQADFARFLAVIVVTLMASTAFFASGYFRETGPANATLRRGVVCGLTWTAVHLVLGFVAFVGGPLEMPLAHFRALAVFTLLVPAITVALAYRVSHPRPA